MLDTKEMKRHSAEQIKKLGISTLQNIDQAVETLSGGQRQAVAVARAAAFKAKVVILDEPTAALGVRETGQVLRLVKDLRDQGLGVILISHNMPNVFDVADRIHIQRLGSGLGVIDPKTNSMDDAVSYMTGARKLEPENNIALAAR
jgi:fructose transport system ATP-binding protein